MTQGAVFFTCGSSHCERLLVAIHSLRLQHPLLPIAVMALDDGKAPAGFFDHLQQDNVQVIMFDPQPGYSALCHKIRSLHYAPFDINLFIDADMVIMAPLDEAFKVVSESKTVGLAFVNFANWRSDGNSISKRIRRFAGLIDSHAIEAAIQHGPAINVGSFVFRRGHRFLQEWEDGTVLGARHRVFIPDEIYAQVSLPQLVALGEAVVLGPEWGESVRYPVCKEPKIVHYHGDKHDGKYPLCDVWRKMRDQSKSGKFQYADNTLVVAVDAAYYKTFSKSLANWRQHNVMNGLRTLLIHDGSLTQEQIDQTGFERAVVYQNPHTKTQRALMLNSFMLCAPFEVETPYWTKLDADCQVSPETRLFESAKWRGYDVVSHRWGYTKPAAWVPTLEAWRKSKGVGKQFIQDWEFDAQAENRTFRSARIQSFACFHNTASSRAMAAPAVADGVLPVPSHDTYLWFMAEALGYKIERVNLHKWGFRH